MCIYVGICVYVYICMYVCTNFSRVIAQLVQPFKKIGVNKVGRYVGIYLFKLSFIQPLGI